MSPFTKAGVAVVAALLGIFMWNVEQSTLPYEVARQEGVDTYAWVFGKGKDGKLALQVARDADGLLWMADPETGTLMVDTGNPLTGILAVTPDGDMYNFFTDSVTGKVAPTKLGNVDDLVTIDTKNLGQVTGFPQETGPLPPNIPLSVDPETGEQEYPAFLEDWILSLVPKEPWEVNPLERSRANRLADLRRGDRVDDAEAIKVEQEAARLAAQGKGVELFSR